jgi:hypothetical protein
MLTGAGAPAQASAAPAARFRSARATDRSAPSCAPPTCVNQNYVIYDFRWAGTHLASGEKKEPGIFYFFRRNPLKNPDSDE